MTEMGDLLMKKILLAFVFTGVSKMLPVRLHVLFPETDTDELDSSKAEMCAEENVQDAIVHALIPSMVTSDEVSVMVLSTVWNVLPTIPHVL